MLFLDIADSNFDAQFAAILARSEETGREVEQVVLDIIADVRRRGDAAVMDLTKRFDRLEATSLAELEVSETEIEAAFSQVGERTSPPCSWRWSGWLGSTKSRNSRPGFPRKSRMSCWGRR